MYIARSTNHAILGNKPTSLSQNKCTQMYTCTIFTPCGLIVNLISQTVNEFNQSSSSIYSKMSLLLLKNYLAASVSFVHFKSMKSFGLFADPRLRLFSITQPAMVLIGYIYPNLSVRSPGSSQGNLPQQDILWTRYEVLNSGLER